ncbi:MAG TPA: response regulator [Thermoanaerobaculia bacterium]|nr:response regulator [Thermoanaerobaculia bacterium]
MMKSNNETNGKVEILIAEDSPTQAAQLAHLLEQQGYTVTTATNGREALSLLDRRRPSLIITDVIMPELDGYGLCKAIKSSEEWNDIPVMLVTTLSDTLDVVRGLECGADNFIRKPYDEKYLLSRLNYLLMNLELRKNQKMRMGVEITLGGQRHFITSERQQILDLLISTYEQAVNINDELKLREKDLAHSNEVLNGLYRVAAGLNQARGERETAELALKGAMELPGIQAGWISLREGESGFRLAVARNLPPALEAPGAMEGDCACRRRLLSGEFDSVINILECERLQKAIGDTRGLLYHASVPLWLGDRTLGVMNLVGPKKGLFNEDELIVLYSVGHQVAVALERARLHEHLEKLVDERTANLKAEIAERKRIEQEEARLVAIIEATPDLVATTDLDGHVLYCNQAWFHFFGRGPGEDLPSPHIREFHSEGAAKLALETAIPHATEHGSWAGETTFLRRDEGEAPVSEVILAHRGASGSVEYLSHIARDMTARVEAEETQRRMERRLEQVQRVNSLGRVAATVAHEFNNVLMGIQPFAEIIRRQAGDDEQISKAAEQIFNSVRRGKRVTEQILRFTRPSESQLEVTDMAKWLTAIEPELRGVAGSSVQITPLMPREQLLVRCDPAQMQQVVTNLVINARDAMPGGGAITLTLAASTRENNLFIGLSEHKRFVHLTVRDTGTGIAPEMLDQIFEPLFTTKHSGTGLGLAVARQVIIQHGGFIFAENVPGGGTAFHIFLPQVDEASRMAVAAQKANGND